MADQSEQGRKARNGKDRFDAKRVRRILERAAAEQYRLDRELADTYTLEELEDMAAEAGISAKALHAAIDEPPRRTELFQPRTHRIRFPDARGLFLIGAAGVALLGVLLAFPVVAQVLFWTTIAFLVLVLLVGSPV